MLLTAYRNCKLVMITERLCHVFVCLCLSVSLARRSDAPTLFHTVTPLSRGCCVKISVTISFLILVISSICYVSFCLFLRSLACNINEYTPCVKTDKATALLSISLLNIDRFFDILLLSQLAKIAI